MENIYILPTDQPSRLYAKDGNYKLANSTIAMDWYISSVGYKPYNIYITSDEQIKGKEWFLDLRDNFLFQNQVAESMSKVLFPNCKKIILTTDPTLIEDGVQAIDDEFLKWFVKNPTCEFVEVKKQEVILGNYDAKGLKKIYDDSYKIIIPQEEPKQEKEEEYFKHLEKDKKEFAKEWEEIRQEFGFDKKEETLEEAAYRLSAEKFEPKHIGFMLGVIEGAKWQSEKMYTEEDLREAFKQSRQCKIFEKDMPPVHNEFEDWFEQFKKK